MNKIYAHNMDEYHNTLLRRISNRGIADSVIPFIYKNIKINHVWFGRIYTLSKSIF